MPKMPFPFPALLPLSPPLVGEGSVVPGVVGASVGAVVGTVVGAVVGAVVGRVTGAGGVLLGVVLPVLLLRQPVKTPRVRTSTRMMQRVFFILKPPVFSDFRNSIDGE